LSPPFPARSHRHDVAASGAVLDGIRHQRHRLDGFPEFIAHAKANPGKISFGSPGIGTPGHVSGELFKIIGTSNNDEFFVGLIASASRR
jgi:Tripartite tricarboxylate transporter family receptor